MGNELKMKQTARQAVSALIIFAACAIYTTQVSAEGAAPAVAKVDSAKAGSLVSNWVDKWPDGTPTGATFSAEAGRNTIVGTSRKNAYGSVYKKVTVELDKTPYLVIDILSTDGFWFIIAKNPSVKTAYVKVQSDDNHLGKFIYDFKALTEAITGMTGKQDLELELGVSSGKAGEVNFGKKMSFKDFRFAAADPGTISGALRVAPWKDKWPNAAPTGAMIKSEESGKFTVAGTTSKQGYGVVTKVISVNLDATPFLHITPESCNGQWYIEAMGGSLKSPVKLQPDTNVLQLQSYDLKNLTGLSGEVNFELHVGVANAGQESNTGIEATFKDLSFSATQ